LSSHGQFFGLLDPILFSATTVRRRSITLPSLFRGHDHVAEASQANHYRAPCCHHRIALPVPALVGFGMTVASRGGIKGKASHGVAITKSRLCLSLTSCRSSFLPPSSFWPTRHQPSSIICSAPRRASYPSVFVDNLQKKLGRRPEKNPSLHR
jgi:hypothetical protein